MALEYIIIIALFGMVIAHIHFRRVYSSRIKRLRADISITESDVIDDDYLKGAISRAKMSAQAKIDHINNNYALVVDSMSVGVMSILITLHHLGVTPEAGWISTLLLPLPVYVLLYHLYNIHNIPVKGWRSLWSEQSAYSR